MRLLIVFAHPVHASLNGSILERVSARLREGGHDLRLIDLYDECFDPVLTVERFSAYNDTTANSREVETHVDSVRWAEGLIVIYPTWWYGQPAILKGWIERVLLPGVAINIDAKGKPAGPKLDNIKLFGAISTYGAPWWWTKVIGDPGRRTLMRGVRLLCFKRCRTFWLAKYNVHRASRRSIERSLDRMVAALGRI